MAQSRQLWIDCTYLDESTFAVEGDLTELFKENRAVRFETTEKEDYTSWVETSSYEEETDETLVSIYNSILTGDLYRCWVSPVIKENLPVASSKDLGTVSGTVQIDCLKSKVFAIETEGDAQIELSNLMGPDTVVRVDTDSEHELTVSQVDKIGPPSSSIPEDGQFDLVFSHIGDSTFMYIREYEDV